MISIGREMNDKMNGRSSIVERWTERYVVSKMNEKSNAVHIFGLERERERERPKLVNDQYSAIIQINVNNFHILGTFKLDCIWFHAKIHNICSLRNLKINKRTGSE